VAGAVGAELPGRRIDERDAAACGRPGCARVKHDLSRLQNGPGGFAAAWSSRHSGQTTTS